MPQTVVNASQPVDFACKETSRTTDEGSYDAIMSQVMPHYLLSGCCMPYFLLTVIIIYEFYLWQAAAPPKRRTSYVGLPQAQQQQRNGKAPPGKPFEKEIWRGPNKAPYPIGITAWTLPNETQGAVEGENRQNYVFSFTQQRNQQPNSYVCVCHPFFLFLLCHREGAPPFGFQDHSWEFLGAEWKGSHRHWSLDFQSEDALQTALGWARLHQRSK